MSGRPAFPPRGDAVMPPRAVPLAGAIAASAPLARLGERLRQSQARFDCIAAALPPALRSHVAAGPVDDQRWVLIADSSAVAAKLRQCLPQIDAALAAAGWPPLPTRVHVRKG